MNHHVSNSSIASASQTSASHQAVRVVFANPPRMNVQFFLYGIREALAATCGKVDIELLANAKPKTESFAEMMSRYLKGVQKMRSELRTGRGIYLATAMASVDRGGNESTLLPVFMCSVLAPHRMLGSCVDTFKEDLDDAEADQLRDLGIISARMQFTLNASVQERVLAEALLEHIRDGMTLGYELIDTPVFSAFRKGN